MSSGAEKSDIYRRVCILCGMKKRESAYGNEENDHTMRHGTAALFFIFLSAWAIAQNPEAGRIFTSEEIPKVNIYIDPDSLEDLYLEENWYSNHEYPATFVWEDSQGADTLDNIGFRFRGNTSRDKFKKSFKVSINSFISGRRYYGLKKLNLNAEVNDPSMIRSNTAWRMYRDMKVPASRANHVEVYINDAYYGLYQNCEHINDDWADERFGDDAGNLYKCNYPANLHFISNQPDAYKLTPPWSDRRVYEIKTNREADDYSDLASFIAFLNQADDETFACEFDRYFNPYTYLKVLAVDVLTGNWDAYLYNQNNFYLYFHPRRARFEYLPYDLDNTWGLDWLDQDWATRNIYNYSPGNEYRPLYERLMATQKFRDIFTYHVLSLLEDGYYTPDHIAAVQELHEFIAASALTDSLKGTDFGYDNDDFLNALDEAYGGHVVHSVLGFAEIRAAVSAAQAEQNQIAPIIWEFREDFSEFPEVLTVRVKTEGPEWSQLILTYTQDGGEEQVISAAEHGETTHFTVPVADGGGVLSYNIRAEGADGLVRTAWCEDRKVYYGADVPAIFINEVMSSNSMTVADEHGDFDDWIEIYNGGETAVNLTGYFLTDKDRAPKYWATPGVTMEPGSFRLFWADDEIEQGPMHTNFKVSSGGEGIYLFRQRPDGIQVVDLIQVPALPTDFSFGRQTDGGLPWVVFENTTPGSSNSALSTTDRAAETVLPPYPNPTAGEVMWKEVSEFQILDISGRLIAAGRADRFDLSAVEAGIYILKRGGAAHRVVRR